MVCWTDARSNIVLIWRAQDEHNCAINEFDKSVMILNEGLAECMRRHADVLRQARVADEHHFVERMGRVRHHV